MPITTASFDSAFWPDDVTGAIALACVTGAPFARSLTPRPTSKGHVSFLVPTRPASVGWAKVSPSPRSRSATTPT